MQKSISNRLYKEFCEILVNARKNKNITQSELASKLNKHQSFVSKYESCERRLDVIEFLDICKAIEIEPNVILSKVSNLRRNYARQTKNNP